MDCAICNEGGVNITNREMIMNDPQGCPMFKGVPLSDKQSSAFCALGCSVICKEEMVKKLEKTEEGRKWLDSQQGEE